MKLLKSLGPEWFGILQKGVNISLNPSLEVGGWKLKWFGIVQSPEGWYSLFSKRFRSFRGGQGKSIVEGSFG